MHIDIQKTSAKNLKALFKGELPYSFENEVGNHNAVAEKIGLIINSGSALTGHLYAYNHAYQTLISLKERFISASVNVEIQKQLTDVRTKKLRLRINEGATPMKLKWEDSCTTEEKPEPSVALRALISEEEQLLLDQRPHFREAARKAYPEIHALYVKLNKLAQEIAQE